MVEKVGDERRGDVVGEVGDQRPGAGAEQGVPVEAQGIPFDHPGPGRLGEGPQDRQHAPVELDGEDVCSRLEQGQGEAAEAGADLHHAVPGPDAGEAGDPPDGVGVDDEVLTEGPAGMQAVLAEQGGDLLAGEGHASTGRPNTRAVDAHVASSTEATGWDRTAATAAPTTATSAGRLGRPRCGTGAR